MVDGGNWGRLLVALRPAAVRPLKDGFAAAYGGALRAPLTGRSPPGLGSACGLSRFRREAPAAQPPASRFKANACAQTSGPVSIQKDHTSLFQCPPHGLDIGLRASPCANLTLHAPDRLEGNASRFREPRSGPIDEGSTGPNLRTCQHKLVYFEPYGTFCLIWRIVIDISNDNH